MPSSATTGLIKDHTFPLLSDILSSSSSSSSQGQAQAKASTFSQTLTECSSSLSSAIESADETVNNHNSTLNLLNPIINLSLNITPFYIDTSQNNTASNNGGGGFASKVLTQFIKGCYIDTVYALNNTNNGRSCDLPFSPNLDANTAKFVESILSTANSDEPELLTSEGGGIGYWDLVCSLLGNGYCDLCVQVLERHSLYASTQQQALTPVKTRTSANNAINSNKSEAGVKLTQINLTSITQQFNLLFQLIKSYPLYNASTPLDTSTASGSGSSNENLVIKYNQWVNNVKRVKTVNDLRVLKGVYRYDINPSSKVGGGGSRDCLGDIGSGVNILTRLPHLISFVLNILDGSANTNTSNNNNTKKGEKHWTSNVMSYVLYKQPFASFTQVSEFTTKAINERSTRGGGVSTLDSSILKILTNGPLAGASILNTLSLSNSNPNTSSSSSTTPSTMSEETKLMLNVLSSYLADTIFRVCNGVFNTELESRRVGMLVGSLNYIRDYLYTSNVNVNSDEGGVNDQSQIFVHILLPLLTILSTKVLLPKTTSPRERIANPTQHSTQFIKHLITTLTATKNDDKIELDVCLPTDLDLLIFLSWLDAYNARVSSAHNRWVVDTTVLCVSRSEKYMTSSILGRNYGLASVWLSMINADTVREGVNLRLIGVIGNVGFDLLMLSLYSLYSSTDDSSSGGNGDIAMADDDDDDNGNEGSHATNNESELTTNTRLRTNDASQILNALRGEMADKDAISRLKKYCDAVEFETFESYIELLDGIKSLAVAVSCKNKQSSEEIESENSLGGEVVNKLAVNALNHAVRLGGRCGKFVKPLLEIICFDYESSFSQNNSDAVNVRGDGGLNKQLGFDDVKLCLESLLIIENNDIVLQTLDKNADDKNTDDSMRYKRLKPTLNATNVEGKGDRYAYNEIRRILVKLSILGCSVDNFVQASNSNNRGGAASALKNSGSSGGSEDWNIDWS